MPFSWRDLENWRDAPAFDLDDRIAILRQHTRQVIDQTAAGDVSETLNFPAGNLGKERLIVLVRPQQLVAY